MADLPIRVAVVSPSHLVRAGLVSLIAELHGRAVVTEVACVGTQLGDCDVAIHDLGAVTDLEARSELRRLLGQGPVVGLVYDSLPARTDARNSVITLLVAPEELLKALEGALPLGPQRRVDREPRLPAGLTEREFRVITLLGEGLTNQQIADELYVSINTVKTYIRTAYRKLRVDHRATAMLWALEHGLAGSPENEPTEGHASGRRPA